MLPNRFFEKIILTATTLVAAVQAFVASPTAHHDVSANITGGRITLHILGCRIHRL
jgi:hypothetical protein